MGQYLYYQLIHLIVSLAPLRFCYWFGARVADVYYIIARQARISIIANLKQVFGLEASEQEIKNCARRNFQNFAKCIVDFFRFSRIDENNISSFVCIRGEKYLKEAFAEGKGVIGLSAHLGNWELGAVTITLLGYPVNAVALSHEQRLVNNLFVKQRTRKGVRVIPAESAAKRCYQALVRGEMVALLGDRDITASGVTVKFFGKETILPRGPATLAVRREASVLPAFMIRGEDNRFTLNFESPICFNAPSRDKESIPLFAEKLAKVLEKYIRRYPEQWFMFHPMWNTQPE